MMNDVKRQFAWGGMLVPLLVVAIVALGGSWGWSVYQYYREHPSVPKATPTPAPATQLLEEEATPVPTPETLAPGTMAVDLTNPASKNCVDKGGTLSVVSKPNGTRYGICIFDDNRRCEEEAMLENECPVGGLKITGYETPEQIYCAITGGEVKVGANTCEKAGKTCTLEAYYSDTCGS